VMFCKGSPEASLPHLESGLVVFVWDFLAFQSSIATLLSASENALTPAGMLLADWLVRERYALAYSCTKRRIFITRW
jgi:hypothetical protein